MTPIRILEAMRFQARGKNFRNRGISSERDPSSFPWWKHYWGHWPSTPSFPKLRPRRNEIITTGEIVCGHCGLGGVKK